jgi:hypothetical protein
MMVSEAQKEVRKVFLNGAVGQIVSGVIWLVSAALATWSGPRPAILALVFGGMFIFPATQLVLRLAGRPASLSPKNPLGGLAVQVAFVVPFTLPVVGGAALYNVNWFYPAFMVVLGAHYLPFIFLYGMRHFGVLAGLLIGGGVWLGLTARSAFSPGGWLTGVLLLLFAAWVGRVKEAGPEGASTRHTPAPRE